MFTSSDLAIWFSMASLSTPKQSLRWTGGTAITRYKSWLSENSQLTSCNYEFYEDMDAFYKLVSRNYGNSDMAWTHLYSSNKDSTILELSSSRQPAASSKQWIIVTNPVHDTPCYSPPEVTRSPHGLLHHTNGWTSPKTTFPITHCTDVTQLIALITQLIALITNHTADCADHTLYNPWTSSLSSASIV